MRSYSAFRTSFFTAVIMLPAVAVCDSDWKYVHSDSKPTSYATDSITWIAIKQHGDNDLWFYVPEEVARATGWEKDPRDKFTTYIFVAGKVWPITAHSDGSTSFGDPGTPPGTMPATIVSIIFIALGLAALWALTLSICYAVKCESKEKAAKAALDEVKAIRAGQLKCIDDLHLKELDLRKRQVEIDRRQQTERQALQAERSDLEQRQQLHLAVVREAKIERRPPTKEEWQHLSHAVRAHQFRGGGTSDHLVVNYYLDPRNSGAIVFMWEVTTTRPHPPALVVLRDGKVFKRESGRFKGEFPCRLLKSDRRYQFIFRIYDHEIKLEEEILLEVTPPPFTAWEPEPPKPISDDEKKRQRENWKNDQYRYAESIEKDAIKLKEKKALIDQETNERFGEI
jgi:hypothetical protein